MLLLGQDPPLVEDLKRGQYLERFQGPTPAYVCGGRSCNS